VTAPTPDEAREWLKESGKMPDLSVTWQGTDEPGSAERHLRLLNMLFGPTDQSSAA
jgi:hypothetical protein